MALKGKLLWRRVHLRPLNNIRSCCLPRPQREGLPLSNAFHISAMPISLQWHCAMHSSVQWDTMQTRRRSACYTSASGECPVTRWGGKHENILSDKFSTIENRGLDKLLSRPACLIALFRKRLDQLLQLFLLLVSE